MLVQMRKLIANKTLLQVVAWATAIVMVFGLSSDFLITKIQKIFGLEDYAILVRGIKLDDKEFAIKQAEYGNRLSSSDAIKLIGMSMLIDSISKQFDVVIGDKYYQRYFAQIIDKLQRQGLSLQDYASIVKIPPQELEKRFQENLKQNFPVQLIDSAIYIPKFIYQLKTEEDLSIRKYAILTFPFDKYLTQAKKENLTQDNIESFYKKNKKNYLVPEKRKVNIWTFNLDNYGIKVSENDIDKYYNSHKNEFIKKPSEIQLRRILFKNKDSEGVKQKAIQVKSELIQGSINFTDAVKKYSDDEATLDKGGLLQMTSFENLSPEISMGAKTLEKDGDVSDIIETEEGLEIIQRESRNPASYKPLDEVKSEIEKSLIKSKFSTRFGFDAKRIIKEAKKNNHKIEDFANSKKSQKSTDTISKSNSTISKIAFRIKTGQHAQYFENNKGYIVELVDIEKPYILELKDIEEKVKEDIWSKEALSKLSSDLNDAYKQLESGATINDIADKFNSKTIITPFVNKYKKDEIEKLSKDGYPVENFINLSKKGTIKKVEAKNGYLIKVADIKNMEATGTEEQQVKIQVASTYKSATEQGFIASLAQTAKIDINVKQPKRKHL